jgi:hypothetical protein
MFDLVKSSLDNRKQRALFQCIAGSLANAAGTERQDVIDRKPIPESLDDGFVLALIEGGGRSEQLPKTLVILDIATTTGKDGQSRFL